MGRQSEISETMGSGPEERERVDARTEMTLSLMESATEPLFTKTTFMI